LAVSLAVGLAAASVIIGVSHLVRAAPGQLTARSGLAPRQASYLGVYEPGAPGSYLQVTGFGRTVGRQVDLAGYFSGWPEPFNTAFADAAYRHGAATLVQVDPTYASVTRIAAGGYDDYLRAFAHSVRAFGHPVVIGFGHEMNAPWYSWGRGHVAPATFVAAWRHLVTVFRGQGASNVTWLWTIQAQGPTIAPAPAWWPGGRYVTWVGVDGYYFEPSDTFASVFGSTIAQVRGITSKPILISETAVGPGAEQAAKIRNLLSGIEQYQLLGLVWFDIDQHGGTYHQDWRIEDDPPADSSFRLGLRQDLAGAVPG
jgi:mannan endo-1,4-beta-mannosidase